MRIFVPMMEKKNITTYIAIFVISAFILSVLPMQTPVVWQPEVMIVLSSLLYTLLVFLSCRLVDIRRPMEVAGTAVFLMLFLPNSNSFLSRDIEAVTELTSQCIVPFFISQYYRVSQKDFRSIHILMLLMGIFCSYTHDGITIPLCTGFMWMWFVHRKRFFRTACWPMVVGFVIGTSLSIIHALSIGTSAAPTDLHTTISQTATALKTLWDTKIFLIAMSLTVYLTLSRQGRHILLDCAKRHALLACCAVFSFFTLPLAPLGLENAVTGACFFCMYWVLILSKMLVQMKIDDRDRVFP